MRVTVMRVTVRILLAFFAVAGIAVGGWQLVAPRSFYTDFPGFGRQWVSPDGPYNGHLLRDAGQGTLAVAVVALVALLSGSVLLARVTGLAALVASVPHQLYHQTNLAALPATSDQVLLSVTLSVVTLAAVLLTAFSLRLPLDAARRPAGTDAT